MKKAIVAFVVTLATSVAAAGPGDSKTPADNYRTVTQVLLARCSLMHRVIADGLVSASDERGNYADCISKGVIESKATLQPALATLKTESAKEALKAYHVAFITALEGINPGLDERRISYEQRQQALSDKVTEAWTRFDIKR